MIGALHVDPTVSKSIKMSCLSYIHNYCQWSPFSGWILLFQTQPFVCALIQQGNSKICDETKNPFITRINNFFNNMIMTDLPSIHLSLQKKNIFLPLVFLLRVLIENKQPFTDTLINYCSFYYSFKMYKRS